MCCHAAVKATLPTDLTLPREPRRNQGSFLGAVIPLGPFGAPVACRVIQSIEPRDVGSSAVLNVELYMPPTVSIAHLLKQVDLIETSSRLDIWVSIGFRAVRDFEAIDLCGHLPRNPAPIF